MLDNRTSVGKLTKALYRVREEVVEDRGVSSGLGRLEPLKRSSKNQASLTFEKGLRVLSCFDIDHPEWTLKDICARTEVARPTAYRLIKTLLDAKFLTRDERTGTYRLGPALLKTAYLMFSHSELARIAHPFMEEMVAETNESAVLAIWRDEDALIVDLVVADHPFVLATTVGGVVSGYSSIHGRAFLAFGRKPSDPPFSWEKIERRTEYTITDPKELEEMLQQARREGVVSTSKSGEWACAPSVRPYSARTVISWRLWASSYPRRFGPAEMRLCAAAVKRTAGRISDTLGHRNQS